ncbi:hypothetical protein [Tumebacillus permanentifrigoris]|uniref:Uncharacterized protein n=1 Tax=Tumebacillus permanentifrigoris TaxID=378543 RepID=A0A316DAC9_9BACL|nr:hypothetical protein [Tumebacillus permanentifrigoris]PWK13949.1 hypothetical protein C7459_106246 [Tumebacillus permanentifrigoris]
MSRAKDMLAEEDARRKKKKKNNLSGSVQYSNKTSYYNYTNAGATYRQGTIPNNKQLTKPVLAKPLTAADWKQDLGWEIRREAQLRRFETWPRHRQRWALSIEDAVSDFKDAWAEFLDSLDEDIEVIVTTHNEYCKAFDAVWRRLCSFPKETPRKIELVQRQWAGLEGLKLKKVGYLHYLALWWSASTGLPVEDFVGLFAELTYTLASEGYIFSSGFYFIETLSMILKSKAMDMYRAEKTTDKRKANYGTVSLDTLDANGLPLHKVLSSPGADPLTHWDRTSYTIRVCLWRSARWLN